MESNTTNSYQTNSRLVESRLDPQREMFEKEIDDAQFEINTQPNAILIVQGRIALEATHDKIIIALDKFRSGYECKVCLGTGIEPPCICGNGKNRLGELCRSCNGEPLSFAGKDCRSCRGVGSTLVLPDSAKALPTSGRIVSCGPECNSRKVGERVLFGAHTGYFLPFKGNVKLRIMREYEPLCLIHGIEQDVALGDFFTTEEGD